MEKGIQKLFHTFFLEENECDVLVRILKMQDKRICKYYNIIKFGFCTLAQETTS